MSWKNDQVSEQETEKILEVASLCLDFDGDFVELGCYKGDTSLSLAEIIKNTKKELWIYDSFEGLPGKNKKDESVIGKDFQAGELLVTKREVKERFLRAGIRLPVIKKAWFSELENKDLPRKIAFAFLDGDFYDSIKDSLKLVEDKMSAGAKIIVHDYNNMALPGVKVAVDEWLKNKDLKTSVYQSMIIIEGF